MNTTSEHITTYNILPDRITDTDKTVQVYVRISVPRSILTPAQLAELAALVQRHSVKFSIRVRSATQLEIALSPLSAPWPEKRLLNEMTATVVHRNAEPRSTLRIHIPGAQLHLRQLRVLAVLMHSEGVPSVRIADSETLILEEIQPGREAIFRLGLRETGLITM